MSYYQVCMLHLFLLFIFSFGLQLFQILHISIEQVNRTFLAYTNGHIRVIEDAWELITKK